MKSLFVIGPSGSGKTTLCSHLLSIYQKVFGQKTTTLINLDPANDGIQNANININQLITIQDIMQQFEIGPNGAIIYSLQFLNENIEWLLEKLSKFIKDSQKITDKEQHLFIFDLPGQIQLYIHHNSLKKIIEQIIKKTDSTPCILQLFDCTYLQNIQHFISLCMMSLTTMINLQMPHINLLNKIDLLKTSQTKINRGLINQYFNVASMVELVQQLDYTLSESCKPVNQNQKHLQMIAKVIDTYGQVSFMPCSLYRANMITNLLYEMQKIFGSINESLMNNKFQQIVKDYDMFAQERVITQLQDELEEEQQQQLDKMNKDMKQ